MLAKVLGVIAGLLGLAMIVFAAMAWREFQIAATSAVAPTANSMSLTRIIYPKFFDSGNPGTKPAKPAELAQSVSNRIYIIGGGSLALIVVGVVLLVLPQSSRKEHDN